LSNKRFNSHVIKARKFDVIKYFRDELKAVDAIVFTANGHTWKNDFLDWIIGGFNGYQNWIGIPF
jgi:hypothetical protein